MDFLQITLLLFISLFGYASSTCYGCNGAGEYCCGYDICCYSVYMSWWFWCILVAVIILKMSCIGCYIRARRRRAAMYYVQAPVTTNVNLQRPTGTVADRTPQLPMQQQQMPPPYHTQPPAYPGPQAGYSQAPPQTSEDSRINKDTQMLVG